MPSVILFDDPVFRTQLLPFTYTRPVALIRCGIHTIFEKWANWLETSPSYLTQPYLQNSFSLETSDDNLYINGSLCPNQQLVESVSMLSPESVLYSDTNDILAVRTTSKSWNPHSTFFMSEQVYEGAIVMIRNVWDIFLNNGAEISTDVEKIRSTRESEKISDPYTRCYNEKNIFVEPGADIKAAILNAEKGPIYIGANATIQEGATIQGPFALGQNSIIAQNAKVRINTTVGPFCKVGGEISGSVLFGYSNKAHDGYLGNSVLGEWCNLGANTNNSNLKNDHTIVKLHNYKSGILEDTGLQLCGLFMGDYSKAGISTMFNTGTVVGVSANVFGAGFQAKHIPSFTWGGKAEGISEYRLTKALSVANDTVSRRGVIFDENRDKIFNEVFDLTKEQRDGF